MDFEITPERRYEVCIHEAAHAVVYAYGGTFVYSVEVVPVGMSDLTLTGRKGHVHKESMGLCCTSDAPFSFCFNWDEEDCTFVVDKKPFQSVMKLIPGWKKRSEIRRHIRAHVCGALAGNVAEVIFRGEDEMCLESDSCWSGTPDDVAFADAMSWLLPSWKEFDRLVTETERLLRTPEIWQRVLNLADVLNREGKLEEDIPFLPEFNRAWPASQRNRQPEPSRWL